MPPGPLLAIWGMETGFGAVRGNVNTLSRGGDARLRLPPFGILHRPALRRADPDDRGLLTPNTRGAAHGEVGHTQFLPKNVLAYGTGDLNNVGAALSSTPSSSRPMAGGPGAGYQPGEPNFAAIQGWNAAPVYEKAIALLGRQIDND